MSSLDYSNVLNQLKEKSQSIVKLLNTPLSLVFGQKIRPWHLVLLAVGATQLFSTVNSYRTLCATKARCSARRRELEMEIAQVPALDRNVVSEELASQLSGMSACELVSKLSTGEITAEQCLLYYAAMAVHCHRQFNCLTHVMFHDALNRARELDRILKETGKPVGPLHGLPISIKECIYVKGTSATGGMAYYLNNIATEDALVVKILREAGAIIYIKSNIPQSMMISETSNPIYGRTINPYNPDRVAGGSSGGEAVLVAAGGAPLGVGTDLGGSVRMPAAWCGVIGAKPTSGRISIMNQSPEILGIESMISTTGPIARTVADAALYYSTIHASPLMYQMDPTTPPVSFNQEIYNSKKPLVVGYWLDDGFFTPSTSVQRAITMALDQLKANGHTIVRFQPEPIDEMVRAYYTLVSGDKLPLLSSMLTQEPLDPSIKFLWRSVQSPKWVKTMLLGVFKILGWKKMIPMISLEAGSADYEHRMTRLRAQYKSNLIKKMQDAQIDVLVVPGPSIAAPLHGAGQFMTPVISSTYFWNLLNFPAISMPVSTVQESDLAQPRQVRDMVDRVVAKSEQNSEGLPVPVQIVAMPWRDEIALRVAGELEAIPFNLADQLRHKMVTSLPK